MKTIKTTYYVRHPDNTYSVADPQPTIQPVKQEPVAWMRENEDCTDCFVWERDEEHTIPLYTTPPSVEAAIAETLEKAAKKIEELGVKEGPLKLISDGYAAAIRARSEK